MQTYSFHRNYCQEMIDRRRVTSWPPEPASRALIMGGYYSNNCISLLGGIRNDGHNCAKLITKITT
jgi:hypothetical protein